MCAAGISSAFMEGPDQRACGCQGAPPDSLSTPLSSTSSRSVALCDGRDPQSHDTTSGTDSDSSMARRTSIPQVAPQSSRPTFVFPLQINLARTRQILFLGYPP